jgi:hypothetical protein
MKLNDLQLLLVLLLSSSFGFFSPRSAIHGDCVFLDILPLAAAF